MITKLHIENFRSVANADLNLGRFTLLTGANNSGKSSFIYALLALKNVVTNPNQALDSFFNFQFINLGGFNQTVFKKQNDRTIRLGIEYGEQVDTFTVGLGKRESVWELETPFTGHITLPVVFPYAGDDTIRGSVNAVRFDWSGIGAEVTFSHPTEEIIEVADALQKDLVGFMPELAAVDGISTQRTFSKQVFATVPMSNQVWTEDELATLLANDRDLEGRVAHYLEKIVGRSFNIRFTPGTAIFYLQTRDRETAFVADLVNEGLGTNQMVALLAKVLNKSTRFICIDEPEIHLHPTIINRLVDALVDIAELEDKQFLISTHSEHFINAMLRNVVERRIAPDAVRAYYLTKDRKGATQVEEQPINEKGQMTGGLKNFYEAELENIKDLFGLTD
jgi:predicted ATPase